MKISYCFALFLTCLNSNKCGVIKTAVIRDTTIQSGGCSRLPGEISINCSSDCLSDADCFQFQSCCEISEVFCSNILGAVSSYKCVETIYQRRENIDSTTSPESPVNKVYTKENSNGISGGGTNCQNKCENTTCSTGYKCIQDGCQRICQMDYSSPLPSNGVLSMQGTNNVVNSGSFIGCRVECGIELPCPPGYNCINEGCSALCEAVDLGFNEQTNGSQMMNFVSREGLINNCITECDIEFPCPVGYICEQNGCDALCKVDGSIDSFTQDWMLGHIENFVPSDIIFNDCHDECTGGCQSGYICVESGCSRICTLDPIDGAIIG